MERHRREGHRVTFARVVPLVWNAAARGFEARPALELARVPCVGELLEIPDAGAFEVWAVRHTPDAPADAELHVVPRSMANVESVLRSRLGLNDEQPTG